MTHEEILQALYDHTLVGHAPEVRELVVAGLADGMGPESMQSGRSVRPWTNGTACAISPTSSARGSPTFTSSMSAPPATCCATSVSICDRSPA